MQSTLKKEVSRLSGFLDGFAFLFRGARRLPRTKGVWWLLVIPVLLNLFIFSATVYYLVLPASSELIAWVSGLHASIWLAILAWTLAVLLFVLILITYALVFSIFAELLGAPFYEEVGVRIDKADKQAIIERSIWQEIKLALFQESQKLLVVLLLTVFGFVMGLLPVIGHLFGVAFGFLMLVTTAGADAVGPALARRGLLLRERRTWVLNNLLPVLGLGCAKALGLIVPIFNIVVLPMASAGGTLLVQKYDTKKSE